MSILDPISISDEHKLDEIKRTIVQNNQTGLDTLRNVVMSNWTTIWENGTIVTSPEGVPEYVETFSAQQVLDTFGSDAIQLFILGNACCQFIESVKPGALDQKYFSAKLPWTGHEDGTVTINN